MSERTGLNQPKEEVTPLDALARVFWMAAIAEVEAQLVAEEKAGGVPEGSDTAGKSDQA